MLNLMRAFSLAAVTLVDSTGLAKADDQLMKGVFGPDSIRIIEVEILDSATGGCWTNLSEVKTYTEDHLRLKGYKIKGVLPDRTLHTEEETLRVMAPIQSLPRQLSRSTINAIRNHVYLDNLYTVQIFVDANRIDSPYNCWGTVGMYLSRQVTDHKMGFHNVPFVERESLFFGRQNVNTEMFDLVKDFIAYIQKYE